MRIDKTLGIVVAGDFNLFKLTPHAKLPLTLFIKTLDKKIIYFIKKFSNNPIKKR